MNVLQEVCCLERCNGYFVVNSAHLVIIANQFSFETGSFFTIQTSYRWNPSDDLFGR